MTHDGDVPATDSTDDGETLAAIFTKRERAAIDLRVPDSGTPWLDAMIRASLRAEFSRREMPDEEAKAHGADCG